MRIDILGALLFGLFIGIALGAYFFSGDPSTPETISLTSTSVPRIYEGGSSFPFYVNLKGDISKEKKDGYNCFYAKLKDGKWVESYNGPFPEGYGPSYRPLRNELMAQVDEFHRAVPMKKGKWQDFVEDTGGAVFISSRFVPEEEK